MAENEKTTNPEKEPAASPAAKKKDAPKKPNFFVRLGRRLKKLWNDYISEMKKVVWMPWKDVKKNTLLVMASIVALGVAIGLVDFVCSEVLGGIAGLIG